MFPKLATNNVPIIGQPFTVKTWVATVVIVCNCPGKEPVLLAGDSVGTCSACQQAFQLHGLQIDPNTGKVGFQVAKNTRLDLLVQH